MNITYCPFCLSETDGAVCSHCGRNIFCTVDPTHLQPGYVLNGTHPYVLGAALGQGGFGITYIALDTVTNRRVAIKEYFPTYCACRGGEVSVMPYRNQEDAYVKGMERFLEEAGMLRDLSDLDSVVDVLDFFERNNSAYLVMEFLEGSSLKDLVEKQGIFPAQPFLEQLKPLMADMRRMHRRGVVHRDIAPDNIIRLPDGRLKLIDFGAARSYLGDRSMTVVVKKGFAPVEQYMRKGTGACTDVYALAATVYYCVTGVVPPESAERQYDRIRLLAPSALGADITPAQERALEKALEIQPSARTQTMTEFMEQLFPAGEKPVHGKTEKPKKEEQEAVPVSDQEQDQEEPPVRDPKKWILTAAAAIVALTVALAALIPGRADPGPQVQASVETETTVPEETESQQNNAHYQKEEYAFTSRAEGNRLTLSGEFLYITVDEGEYVTVTLSGLDLKDAYITNRSTTPKNRFEYTWEIILDDGKEEHRPATFFVAKDPGQEKLLSLEQFEHEVLRKTKEDTGPHDYTLRSIVSPDMSYTENSITWKYTQDSSRKLNFWNIESFKVVVDDPSLGLHLTRTYTKEVGR